jgi:inosine-uridine nucleoside N-ribohydrolase
LSLYAQRNSSGPAINILGITTVCGNSTVDYIANNVTRTLDTVQDRTTPIYLGMANPMISPFKHLQEPPFFGVDGFGDADLPPITTRVESEHAVDAIIRLAEAYRGQLSILCLGPLTNLAMALKLRPEIKSALKEVFILGGNINGQGNATLTAEYNFLMDPEAAKVVLEELSPCPLVILPWETILQSGYSTCEFRKQTLGTLRTPEVELLNKVEATILENDETGWTAGDALIAASLINPNVIKAQQDYYCTVELNGSLTRGMVVVDRNDGTTPTNATIILDIDLPLVESMLLQAVRTANSPKPKRRRIQK